MMESLETLTNEQLCALAQRGNRLAADRLIEKNLPFVQRLASRIAGNPSRAERFSVCGIEMDDLVQVGSLGLWRAIDGYSLSSGNKFLTYAAVIIKRAMGDLIREYSQNTVWRLKKSKARPQKIVYLDEPLDDVGEDTVESQITSPKVKTPEQIMVERETKAELQEALDALPDRENVYVQYRFGFTDDEAYSLTKSAQHFRLTESRARSIECFALKVMRHELLFEIPERAFAKAEDRLTKILVNEDELHAVELRLKSQQKHGKKIAAAVYDYLADCDGAWGELRYDFKNGVAEVFLLAEWDTIVSHRFAMRAIEYLRTSCKDTPPAKIVLTFITPEQVSARTKN